MTHSGTLFATPAGEVIEDMYPLSPLQRGLLFHLLRDPDSAGYISQVTIRMHGVDLTTIRTAWQLLAERHPVLRTGFLWEGLDEPVQVVYRWAPLPIQVRDLCGLNAADRERGVIDFLLADRQRGFRPEQTPLARLALLHLEDDVVQLVWTHHTIVLDGWSSALLFDDLERIESALAEGIAPPPVSGLPFRDYIGRIRDRDPDRDAAYWREILAGVDSATPLPLAGQQGGGADDDAAQYELVLSTVDSERIRAALRELGVPFSVLAQGAWALTLSRYGNLDDVVFGLTVSGRTVDLPGVDRTVGLLTNTVPVRVKLRPEATAGEWLRELAGRHAATMAHEHGPLTEVRRHSGVPGGRPLFETVLVVQNFPLPKETGTEADRPRITHVQGYESVHYPLVLFLLPGEQLVVRVAYRRGVVSDRSAQLLAAAVRAALVGLADGARPLDAVPVFAALDLPPASPSTGPDREWAGPGTVPEVFTAVAAATPDAAAVIGSGLVLTYRELDQRSDALASVLAERGAGVECRVAVVLERSVESVTAMLGVLKAGAVYVPVDPSYPAARIGYLLADSACRLIVTRSDLRDVLPPDTTAPVICLDELAGGGPLSRRPIPRPDNLAYVIYTSGSTGPPKGVMISHRAVLNTLLWMIDEFGLGGGHVVAHKVPVSFTDAVFEVLWPLCAGAAVSIMDSDTVRDADAFRTAMRARGVTHTLLVPRQIEAIAAGAGGDDPLPKLTWVANAAEPLPPSFVERWDAVCERARINNIYGMTESAIFSVCQHLPRGLAARSGAAPIGLPGPNTTARVLNGALEPCPPGVLGELYLGGTGIARGYLGRQGMTAKRFVPDPFGPAGARLYRTGDLARWLPGGSLDYVGRVDFQVKVRGLRVEPGEVETALREHPAVRDAVVVGHDGRLAGYLVAAGASRSPTDTIREWLAARLPEHLVPALLIWLDELPMTAHGKVDRRRLPEPSGQRDLAAEPVPPRTPVERTLAETWAAVLGIDRVGVHDDFFELGGDSLLAIRLVGRVREVIPVEYTVGALFEAPTVAAAAEQVSDLLGAIDDRLGALLTEIENLPADAVEGSPAGRGGRDD